MTVIAGLDYPSRVAIAMLTEMYKEMTEQFGDVCQSGGDGALTKKAKKSLENLCKKYDELDKVDKAAALNAKVDLVKTQMQSNIAGMLKNTEQAESLAEKSDQLNEQASVFKKKSADLRKHMAWKNLKMTLLLGGVVVIILIVLLAPLIKKARN